MARLPTLTVVPAVSARARHFQVVETAESVWRCAGVECPKGRRRRSPAEALACPRLIPYHLVVGEHLFDGRAGR